MRWLGVLDDLEKKIASNIYNQRFKILNIINTKFLLEFKHKISVYIIST